MTQTFTSGTAILGYSGTGTTLSGTTYTDYNTYSSPNYLTPIGNIGLSSINKKAIMQNKVTVFKVTRNDKNEITSTEFIKELWVQTKNGQSVEFEVARDKDLAKYKAEDLSIRVIYTVTF